MAGSQRSHAGARGMTFVNPMLMLAAAGVALPILAHLLNRYKVKHTDWAAMRFLNRSVRVRSRQLRLRDLLLLAMRCLALLLLVIALSRPAWQGTSQSWFPGERRAGVVIAIDTSFSMQHGGEDSRRCDRAIEQATVIAEQLRPGDPVSLVRLGGVHDVVVRNMTFDPDAFGAMLREQDASPESLDLTGAAELLRELAEELDAAHREVYLITDTQAGDWSALSTAMRGALTELGHTAKVFMVPVPGGGDNLAVTDLRLVSGVLRKGTIARYQATVRNCGPDPVADVVVRCRIDGVQIDSKTIPAIAPGESQTVSLFVPFHNAGPTRITAEINADTLSADNVRRVVAVVQDRVSVLCVDGSGGGVGRLVEAALLARSDNGEDEDYVVRTVPWFSFSSEDLTGADVVVLANVPEVTAEQAADLSSHVRRGNGLVWFAGDHVHPARWNLHSSAGATPLLPASLGAVVDIAGAQGAGKPLDPAMPDHPICLPLRSLPEDLFTEALNLRLIDVQPSPASFTVLRLAGSGAPVLLEHTLGRGQVFMFTTTADATWNNMALTPVFPMLMQQIVTYLAGREFEQPRIVGDSLLMSYVDQPDASDAIFDTPSGEAIAVPVGRFNNQYVALLDQTRQVGFYTARVSVDSPGMPIAVNVDTRESDVKSVSGSDLRASLDGTGIEVVSADNLAAAIEAARTGRSSWRAFMIAGLVLLLIEGFYADGLLRHAIRTSDAKGPQGE